MEKKQGQGRKGSHISLLPNELRACRGGGKGIAGQIVARDGCWAEVCEVVSRVWPHGVEGRATATADKATEVLLQRCRCEQGGR